MHSKSSWMLLTLLLIHAGCQSSHTVKLINWNTYHLFDHEKHTAAASQWLSQQTPAIVAMQEVLHSSEDTLLQLATTWGHDYAVMHKQSGYPVALTSSNPIEVIERRSKGFHHGYLHARTHGLDVLVVHFWPNKVHEAEHVAALARKLSDEGRPVIVMGDFNAEIRHDEAYLQEHGQLGQVVDGARRFDYRITDAFLNQGFIDLTHQQDPDANYTFGSPALIPRWRKNMTDVRSTRRRIDYVFADPDTAKQTRSATVITNDATVGKWSDHYPIMAILSPSPTAQ